MTLIPSKQLLTAMAISASFAAAPAFADTIDPETFSADLAVGESVKIEKTVVIEASGSSSAVVDVHFLIDTSGSMGTEISAAKAASSALFSSLVTDFGDVSAGVGVFSEGASLTDPDPRGNAVYGTGLTTDSATFTANVNDVTLNNPNAGFDFPESGFDAITLAGGDLDWRPGSSRFMFVFTDATGKGDVAAAAAALAADDITLVALAYSGNGGAPCVDTGACTSSGGSGYGTALGATVFASSATTASILADVTAGISAGFADYGSVTVGDLGAGAPLGIDVSTVCTSASIGACVGADAIGDYDRSVDRTFTYDVTFTRTADGDANFFTNALVDGRIVAREADSFPGAGMAAVPVPAGLPLLLGALGLLGFARRSRKA